MRRATVAALVFLASFPVLAQRLEIPVTNWTVPPYNAAPA